MALTPMDIYNKEFEKSRKGYNAEQVDIFLDEVVEEYEKLYKLNISLKEKNDLLIEKINNYRSIETALNKTLNTAETTAKDLVENANQNGSLIVKQAEARAHSLIQEAEERAKAIVYEAEEKTLNARRTSEELKRQILLYKNRVIGVLETQLKTIKDDYDTIMAAENIEETPYDEKYSNEDSMKNGFEKNIDNNRIQVDQDLDDAIKNEHFFSKNTFDNSVQYSQDDNFYIPDERKLKSTFEEDFSKPVIDSAIPDETFSPKENDSIYLGNFDGKGLKIESKESEHAGYSLEDAFSELKRAAAIYSEGNDEAL